MVTVHEDRARFGQDPQQEQEWLRQLNLIYSGLIGIGVVMIQPFLTAASLDLTATICVVAFSVAIPLLAALLVFNRQELFRGRATPSLLASTARVIAQASAFTGVVAGFWHILWIAGVGMLAFGLVGVGVHSAGWWRLEQDRLAPPNDGEAPGATAP
jgi:fatty acid desaturase